MNKTHLKAYTNAIVEAALSRSVALEIELAVGFAVLQECDGARRLARETLLTIYNAAGSKCAAPTDIDWKAINRRISASIALYEFIGADDLAKWSEGKTKRELVDAFRPHIAALKLKSVNEVLLACDKIRAPRKPNVPRDQTTDGRKIETKHLHLNVPKTATKDEIIELATQLMTLAMSMNGTHRADAEQPEQVEA